MKNENPSVLVSIICWLFMASCSTATPEKCFGVAVLNSNLLAGFANEGSFRELESPSMKMGKTKDEFAPMKRTEVVSTKISFIEENLKKIEDLEETADTKDIRQASLTLYHYVLPVYKTEYIALANLYDGGASNEQLKMAASAISGKHSAKFEELYNTLISSGKRYAAKHDIKVNWEVGRM
jgi:uncharacterized protein Yka (UPF0111/DUF47 family)